MTFTVPVPPTQSPTPQPPWVPVVHGVSYAIVVAVAGSVLITLYFKMRKRYNTPETSLYREVTADELLRLPETSQPGGKKSLIARLIARLRYQTPPAVTDIEAGRARSIAEEMQEE